MNKAWMLLVVCAVAVAAFFLGEHFRAAAPAPAHAPPAVASQAAGREPDHSQDLSAEPVRTFRGPDALPHIINYGTGEPPDSNDPVLVKAAVLADMKNHPINIARAYDLELSEVKAIADGQKPFPEALLPKAPAGAPGK